MKTQQIIDEIDNALFLSKEEEDTIEHIDISYSAFMGLLAKLIVAVGEDNKRNHL